MKVLSRFSEDYQFIIGQVIKGNYTMEEMMLPTDSSFEAFELYPFCVVDVNKTQRVGINRAIVEMISLLEEDSDMDKFDYHITMLLEDLDKRIGGGKYIPKISFILTELKVILDDLPNITKKKYKKHRKNLLDKLENHTMYYNGEVIKFPTIIVNEFIYTYGVEDLNIICNKIKKIADFTTGYDFEFFPNGVFIADVKSN